MRRADSPFLPPAEPGSPRRPPPPLEGACALCVQPRPLSFHHLIPRRNHDRRWFRLRFSLNDMRSRGLWVCRPCHEALHRHFDEATLGRRLNTREALLAEPVIARHVEWAHRQRVAGPSRPTMSSRYRLD